MAKIVLSIGEDANEHLSIALHKQIAKELIRLGHEVSVVKSPARNDLNERAKAISAERKGTPLSIEELARFMASHKSRTESFHKKLVKNHPAAQVFSLHDGSVKTSFEGSVRELVDQGRGEYTGPAIEPGDHVIVSVPNGLANHSVVEVILPRGSTHPDLRKQIQSFVRAVDPLYRKAEESSEVCDQLRVLQERKKLDIVSVSAQLKIFNYLLSESNLHAAKHFGLVTEGAARKIALGIHEVAIGKKKPRSYRSTLPSKR